jgi:uncharacterized protein DUF6390
VTKATEQRLPAGHALFARYAFPPNELGYCGPADAGVLLRGDNAADVAASAKEFDGAWPYLTAIADSVNGHDPLDEDVVRSYWVGGPMLAEVDPLALQSRLREAFTGQVTGLLADLPDGYALAHHSFHVFVVYPWVRFLDRDATTPLKVMQDCRVRWGTVQAVDGDWAVVTTQQLTYADRVLALGQPTDERLRWSKDGTSLAPRPTVGQTVSAHWDWICGALTDEESAALSAATQTTLDVVNAVRA